MSLLLRNMDWSYWNLLWEVVPDASNFWLKLPFSKLNLGTTKNEATWQTPFQLLWKQAGLDFTERKLLQNHQACYFDICKQEECCTWIDITTACYSVEVVKSSRKWVYCMKESKEVHVIHWRCYVENNLCYLCLFDIDAYLIWFTKTKPRTCMQYVNLNREAIVT